MTELAENPLSENLLSDPTEFSDTENPPPKTEIPEGWVKDRVTGEMRPPKRRGRQPRATNPDTHAPITRAEDTEPDPRARGKRASSGTPRYQKGVIAKGMATLYRRTGRIVKALGRRNIGIAIIESAEDIGDAYEELARTNPRVRAFLTKLVAGGSWGNLVMAHMPIFLAIAMEDSIRKHLPFSGLLDSLLSPDDQDGSNEISEMLGNLRPEDAQQLMGLAQSMMGNMFANGMPNA